MTLVSTISLAAALFLLAISPGPGVFATVSRALGSGFKSAVPVVAGIVCGDLVFLLLAIYGLAAIAETFGTLFMIVRYLGSGYLLWLGVRLWRTVPQRVEIAAAEPQSRTYSFVGGLCITLGNPKVILFYLGFLPTFVSLDHLTRADIAVVATVVTMVLGSVMLFYAYSASRARQLFTSTDARKNMNRAAGTVMIGTGFSLLVKTA